jgi:hypothetical protein
MSVEELEKVDVVSMTPDGQWLLIVSDHLEWIDSTGHQHKLQKKLNRYLAFIEGGEIYEQFPKAKGQPIVIDVQFKYMPDEEGWNFLERVRTVIEGAGFQFQCKLFKGSVN